MRRTWSLWLSGRQSWDRKLHGRGVRGSPRWDDAFDGGSQFFGFEAEGAGFAFVGDVAGGVDQVHAVGPAGVDRLGGVAEFVEQGGNLDSQLAHAGPSHRGAFFFVLGSREDDLIFDVALHLPDVAGVGLGDVNDEEGDLAPVLIVKFIEGGSLPPERRSGIAAENQNHRPLLV